MEESLNMNSNDLVKISIRGFEYKILRSKLKLYPETSRLYSLQKKENNLTESILLCDYYEQDLNQ